MKIKNIKWVMLVAVLMACFSTHAQTSTQCLTAPPSPSGVYTPCSMAPQPNFAQAPISSKSSGSVASINASFGSNTIKTGTLFVAFANGNNNNPASPITDTLNLTWFKAAQVNNGSAFEAEVWFAPNTVGGAETITVTPGGANASIAMTIYEVSGPVYPAINSSPTGIQSLDQTTTGTVTAGTSPSVSITPLQSNEYVFAVYGLGTAAQTITVASPFNNDSGQQNPTTPAGLFSFVSSSYFTPDIATYSPSATATSEPWAVAVASFRTLAVPIQGRVIPQPSVSSSDSILACNILSASSNNSTSCKGSSGNFYGYEIFNTTTTVYYLRLYNSSVAPTCSSATGFIRSIPIPPANASGQVDGAISNQIFPTNYGTGIGYCITGGSSSTDNTNAATGVFGEIRYK